MTNFVVILLIGDIIASARQPSGSSPFPSRLCVESNVKVSKKQFSKSSPFSNEAAGFVISSYLKRRPRGRPDGVDATLRFVAVPGFVFRKQYSKKVREKRSEKRGSQGLKNRL